MLQRTCVCINDQAVAAESAGVVALVMARTEDDKSRDSPPTARIFRKS